MIANSTRIAPERPPEGLVELQARHAELTSQRSALHARMRAIEETLPELRDLVGEVETRVRAQEGEVARLMAASGSLISTGRDYTQRTVRWTSGGETIQLSGPRPLGTPRGDADQARRVYDALEAEAQPVRASLNDLEREHDGLGRSAGLLGGEIGAVEQQIARMRAEEAGRAAVLGERLDWRERLAAILRRLGGAAGALVL